jgi:hypothetical protein
LSEVGGALSQGFIFRQMFMQETTQIFWKKRDGTLPLRIKVFEKCLVAEGLVG